MPHDLEKYPWAETNQVMIEAGFNTYAIRKSHIWAAKERECPKCHAQPHQPCRNMTGIKKWGFNLARENKYPHPERVDYDKLKQALKDRGYC